MLSFRLNIQLQPGKRKEEHVVPSLIIKQSKNLPAQAEFALGVHAETFVPKGTLVGIYGGEIIAQSHRERLFWSGTVAGSRQLGSTSFSGTALRAESQTRCSWLTTSKMA